MNTTTEKIERTEYADTDPRRPGDHAAMRSRTFVVRRRRWPGVLAAMIISAGVAAVLVSNYYDERSLGERVDATVANANDAVQQRVDSIRGGASEVAATAAQASERVAERAVGTVGDAGITASVKAALAADPTLSALRIKVDTKDGVVRLEGPAPDAKSRERASVLAAAPSGVVSVDNRLVVPEESAPKS